MELQPNIGIGEIKFGMFQQSIYETQGIPNKITHSDSDPESLYLEYNEKQLRLTVYKNENNRVGYLQSSHPEIQFEGKRIIGKSIDVVKTEVFGKLIKKWEIEDYDFFTTYGNDDYWITLNVEFGKVISVELGAPWKNENEYDWPSHFKTI